ncbi:FG-GAP-like repeat-containing protein [Sphingomonas sp. KRR8]|uniref:FG-GAP-like repeat-containing protein n=1 Tax=Sphingomonas sp. KRR8 TaxID=2942996 RepID=UPI0020205CE2|nr:FG-GAP-like repeat-containing protein [Sphingomonas sp. KRR8]URD60728.1 FG-GAP-like repeat-containing protein [Sphingomonas sp. KRR8]
MNITASTVIHTSGTAFQVYNGLRDGSSFRNAGEIWAHNGAVLVGNSFGDVVNLGLAVAEGDVQVTAFSAFQSLTNQGSIYAVSSGLTAALAIWDYGGGLTEAVIRNSGLIAAQTEAGGAVYAIRRENGGSIYNSASGSILAEGGFATAIAVMRGGVGTQPTIISNDGRIEAVSLAAGATSVAIGASHGAIETIAIINNGLIRGDYAIAFSEQGYQPPQYWGSETVTNGATGVIEGLVDLGDGHDTLINQGVIHGDIHLGTGNDRYEGAQAASAVVVFGDAGYDSLVGGAFDDRLTGGIGDDVLTGGLGHDVLSGEAGFDTFRDTAAGLDGDTIVDFAVGDRILITDATPANFSFTLTGQTLTFSGGTITFATPLSGPLVATGAPSGGVRITIATVTHAANNDFNGDGRSDVLLGRSTGAVTNWLGQADGGFTSNHQVATYVLATAWHVAASGDVNGDGRVDLILRNEDGTVTEWLGQPDGGFTWNSGAVYALATAWHIVGTGDVNGDGRADLVLSNGNGQLTDWLGQADGTFFSNHQLASYVLPAGWSVAAMGDFDGDGRSDLLLRLTPDGTVTEWMGQADGSFRWNDAATNALHPAWTVEGAADIDGDGRSDLVLRNTVTGVVTDWIALADGSFASNHAKASYALDAAWKVEQIGDYNGDGMSDLLLRRTDGTVTEWLGQADGGFSWNSAVIYSLDAGWAAQPGLHSII